MMTSNDESGISDYSLIIALSEISLLNFILFFKRSINIVLYLFFDQCAMFYTSNFTCPESVSFTSI